MRSTIAFWTMALGLPSIQARRKLCGWRVEIPFHSHSGFSSNCLHGTGACQFKTANDNVREREAAETLSSRTHSSPPTVTFPGYSIFL